MDAHIQLCEFLQIRKHVTSEQSLHNHNFKRSPARATVERAYPKAQWPTASVY